VPAAATWFASCARSGLLCTLPTSTRTPDSLVPDIQTGADVLDLKSLADYRFIVTNLPYREQAAILADVLPIAARDGVRVAVLARSGARPRLAARSFTRTRGSLVKSGSRSGLSGFAHRSRRRTTGSVGSSGRRSRAQLAKTPFCASLAMCPKDAEDGWDHTSEVHRARSGKPRRPEAGIAPARVGCGA
jgi:hypothetical protein